MTPSRSLGHRAPLLWLALPMMGGLALGHVGARLPPLILLGVALLAAGAAVVGAWRWHWSCRPALVVSMVLAGNASYHLHRGRLASWDALPPREARVELRIDRVFPQAASGKASGLATVLAADTHLRDLIGQRLYFSLTLRKAEAPPIRSSVVQATGVLVTLPFRPPGDTFDGYLAAAGMNFRLTRGRIVANVRGPSPYYRFCERARVRFTELLSTGVDAKRPELAAVLRAMLLGQKHEISDEQGTLFMRSGTMHLFAISGLHIGVIAAALHAVLSALRLPRSLRFTGALSALWLYVEITGATPSAVRAFLMVALVETAILLRLPPNPVSALATSALIVALVWPLQIFSASFQMSYGIVAALLLFGLPLSDAVLARWSPFRLLPKVAWRWPQRWLDQSYRKTVGAVAIGVATTLVSTLCGVLFFELFTPVALLANLGLIPAAFLVILGGFASLLAGLAGATMLSALFNHAAVLVLWAIDALVRLMVVTPGAWRPAQFDAAWIGPAALLALLGALIYGYANAWRRERGGWLPPVAVVVLALWLGATFNPE